MTYVYIYITFYILHLHNICIYIYIHFCIYNDSYRCNHIYNCIAAGVVKVIVYVHTDLYVYVYVYIYKRPVSARESCQQQTLGLV